MWWMGSSGSSNSPTATFSWVRARKVVGPTNRVACSVMSTFTLVPRFWSWRTISADL